MPGPTLVFNHVGHVVTDLARSRRFYEELLGFTYWWEFEVPDELGSPVLRVPAPMGMTAAYLIRDGLVLELMQFAEPGAQAPRRERVMNEPGLTHLSIATDDFDGVLARVPGYGGEVLADTRNDMVAFIRDPDGQLIEIGTMAWRDMLPPLPEKEEDEAP
ncbi:MAG TPA: VOC family protein [Acidimicrobiia bacterium]|nr:VOC family protein [Acidimicrobiia bacterium]